MSGDPCPVCGRPRAPWAFVEGDARCGAYHELARAVCALPEGHEGDHRNAHGYWMPRVGEHVPLSDDRQAGNQA